MTLNMKTRNKSMILVDQHIEMNPEWMAKLKIQEQDVVILDPENLFIELDWTQYEDDVRVINIIYSRLFEDVVMNNKKLICFWPLAQQYGSDWFELESLCKENSCELELFKSGFFDDGNYGFSEEMLKSWKSFVFFLMESLFEDIQLNEHFDEIATLKSSQNSIILFTVEQEGVIRYSFARDNEFLELAPSQNWLSTGDNNNLESFETFNEMLEKLLMKNDLSLYESKFVDIKLEKTYFNFLAKEFKTKNLIENWLNTYSMN